MASQPANTAILVHRRVRSQRDLPFHRSTFETFQRVNPQVMAVPGEEHLGVSETRELLPVDTNGNVVGAVLDTSLTIGRAVGLPVVRILQAPPTLEDAAEGITGLNFPVKIGADSFLEKSDANVADDLHQDLRDV